VSRGTSGEVGGCFACVLRRMAGPACDVRHRPTGRPQAERRMDCRNLDEGPTSAAVGSVILSSRAPTAVSRAIRRAGAVQACCESTGMISKG
jgi:hypothetical protein